MKLLISALLSLTASMSLASEPSNPLTQVDCPVSEGVYTCKTTVKCSPESNAVCVDFKKMGGRMTQTHVFKEIGHMQMDFDFGNGDGWYEEAIHCANGNTDKIVNILFHGEYGMDMKTDSKSVYERKPFMSNLQGRSPKMVKTVNVTANGFTYERTVDVIDEKGVSITYAADCTEAPKTTRSGLE